MTCRRVIHVENGSYRSATISGAFEIEDQEASDPIKVTPKGKERVRVIFSWHGVVPPTTMPNLDVTNAEFRIEDGYSGDVVDDVS